MGKWVIVNLAATMVLIALTTATTYVLAHELTHLALAEEPMGVCIGACESNGERAMGYAYADKHNKMSVREDIPNVVGLIAAAVMAMYGAKAMIDNYYNDKYVTEHRKMESE